MADFPSTEQLRQLAEQQGPKALTCYYWRHALRCFVALGERPLAQLWSQDSEQHFYQLVRANILVFKYLTDDVDKDKLKGADFAASAAASAAFAGDASAAAAASAAAFAAFTAAFAATASADAAFASDFASAASFDFNYLQQHSVPALLNQPLWSNGQPEPVTTKEQPLYHNLEQAELGFLIADIKALLSASLSPQAIDKYLPEFSKIELSSAASIERALFQRQDFADHYGVRVLMLGPGGAGKTSLTELLTQGKTEKLKAATKGVDYQQHRPLDLSVHRHLLADGTLEQELAQLQLFLWDFGGQAIFHSLHHAFMHENCVYVLVVDSRHEQAPDEWLEQIKAATNNQGRVLLITNWFDGIQTQQNREGLKRRFPGLLNDNSFFDFHCLKADQDGFKRFVRQLVAESANSTKVIHNHTRQAFELLADLYLKHDFIELSELMPKLLTEIDGLQRADLDELLHKLSEFGRFVNLDADQKRLCLKPEWVIDMAYQLMYHPQVRQQLGKVSSMAVAELLGIEAQGFAHGDKILEFMCHHKVAVELKAQSSTYDKCYFIPDAAPIDETELVDELLNDPQALTLKYELPLMPIGLRARLVSSLMADDQLLVDEDNNVWRDGLILTNLPQDGWAVVQYQYRRQLIELTLIGAAGVAAELIKRVDQCLAEAAGRTILGQPIYHLAMSQLDGNAPHAELEKAQQQDQKFSELQGRSGMAFCIQGNNHTIVFNSNITDSAVGELSAAHSANRA